MNTQNETGHAKNVANLQKLIERISIYPKYNPPVEGLAVEKLQALYNDSLTKINELDEKRNWNKSAIYARQAVFSKLKPTCTRIVNLLDILGLPQGTIDQAKSLNKLIQGSAKKNSTSTVETSSTIRIVSSSRQSFTRQTDNFSILVQLLSTIPNYKPNEEDLKLESLKTLRDSMMSATQTVDQTEAELNSKLMERDRLFYEEGSCLVSIVQNVKKYVKGAYGATSLEYTNVAKIAFSSMNK